MAVLLVTYDLRKPFQDYPDLLKYIRRFSWARLSESCYAIQTDLPVSTIYAGIRDSIDANDQVYVITLKGPYSGFGPRDVNTWLDRALTVAVA